MWDFNDEAAWRMFNQIRMLLSDGDLQLEGSTAEVDEPYVGGRREGNRGRPMSGDKKKVPVVGIAQRIGRVIAKRFDHVIAKTLVGLICKHVVPGSVVYTDEFNAYNTVARGKRQIHRRIRHRAGVHVRGDIQIDTVEGLWSLVNPGISGVHHSVSPDNLQSYLDEYCFRYNRRHEGNLQFKSILERASRA